MLLDAWMVFPPDDLPQFTDEASLLEACRIPVHAIPGEPANLKVTMPDDLRRVEQALAPAAVRVGFGHDSHPFGPETGLLLGGIEIPGAPRLVGHSDGDVVLHAVADALLGAAGLGDLGRLFPADARTPRGIASEALLREAMARVSARRAGALVRRRRGHRRPTEVGRPARIGDGRCDRGDPGHRAGRRQREGLDGQPRG